MTTATLNEVQCAYVRQLTDELQDAADELASAWEALADAVVRRLEGWDDPQRRVMVAYRRMRVVTVAANAVLERALDRSGGV